MTAAESAPDAAGPAVSASAPGRRRIHWAWLVLAAIIMLAAILRLSNLEAVGQANTYYTAAVEGMLQSPSNFFFGAAEPGGSVTVDKPPVGLWLQVLSAALFGVNGPAVVLPQVIAGVLSVLVLYALVRRHFGETAGLIGALALAVSPVAIAVDRNNTMDSTLVLVVLLSAWAFVRATDSGRLRWLILAGVLTGVAFNIKMLQAYLPIPAFFALYVFSTRAGWRRRIGQLCIAAVAMLVVSLSWAVVTQLTPASMRPYIGSTQTNNVFELIVGYNGIERLLGAGSGQGGPHMPALPATDSAQDGATLPAGSAPSGSMFGSEVGQPGVLRLFTQPLDNEIGWLLPFALLSVMVVAASVRPRLPLEQRHQGLILWGGWLALSMVFFSAANFIHAYYMIMLAVPVAALTGAGTAMLWSWLQRRPLAGAIALLLAAGLTASYQLVIAGRYLTDIQWQPLVVAVFVAGAITLVLGLTRRGRTLTAAGFLLLVAAMTITPLVWSAHTNNDSSNGALPAAYAGDIAQGVGGGRPPFAAGGQNGPSAGGTPPGGSMPFNPMPGEPDRDALIAYLEARAPEDGYLLAVPSAQIGAEIVLATSRAVLYMGGFNGGDPVATPESLQALVDAGELRYVLDVGSMLSAQKPGIAAWLTAQCVVDADAPMPAMPQNGQLPTPGGQAAQPPPIASLNGGGPPGGPAGMGGTLYDCAPMQP